MYTLSPQLTSLDADAFPIAQPFTRSTEHLQAHFDRIRLMIQRHMRRFADRLLKRDGTYSDRSVGPQELKRLLGLGSDPASQSWVSSLGIAELDTIQLQLTELDARIDQRLHTTFERTDTAPPLLTLEAIHEGFHLSTLERDLLLAAAAPRLSIDMARLYTVAWTDFSTRQAPASFLAELVTDNDEDMRTALACLHDDATLIKYKLLERVDQDLWRPSTPLVHASFSVPQRILDYLSEVKIAQSGLRGCSLVFEALDPSRLIMDEKVLASAQALFQQPRGRGRFLGYASSGRRTVLRSLSIDSQRPTFEIDPNLAFLERTPTGFLSEMTHILRESQLHGATLLLRMDTIQDPALESLFKTQTGSLRQLLDPYPGPLFVTAPLSDTLAGSICSGLVDLSFGVPSLPHQRLLWQRALAGVVQPDRVEALSSDLSRSYRLTSGAIFHAVTDARIQSTADANADASTNDDTYSNLDIQHLLRAVRRQLNHNLGDLADVIPLSMTLDKAVLSDEVEEGIKDILDFAKHSERVFNQWRFKEQGSSGQGLSVMFSGPPGTGKTMMASIIAHELGKVLYRIDLSSVVDKYIGETEKNLGRIFGEAERAQAVLLFDEADSLFAKRTQVKSSNDRYANLEVNYLLQKIDDYRGVSILTTNFSQNVDEAFMRRIRFKLEFPMPDAEMRAKLWKNLQPPGAPIDEDIDWLHLGESFEFSGGNIRSTVLRAAVYASARDSDITEELLFDAAVAESREMGLLVRY